MIRIFHISESTIRKYLKTGRQFGWCDYITETENKKNNMNIVCNIKNNNPEYTIEDIYNTTGINKVCIRRYLKEASKYGNCEYDGKNALSNSRKSITYVYDKNTKELLGTYNSVLECSNKSIEDFGVKFETKGISLVCTGKYKSYKNYLFSHTLLDAN